MTFHLFLLAVAVAAIWLASLYLRPFGACPRCHGTGNVIGGSKRKPRPRACPRCKGVGRRQRPGSRMLHQLARRVRRELTRQRQAGRTEAGP